jgi:hypothetical protein
VNTHYALVVFSGDFDGDHPDPDLRGTGPSATLVAAGPAAHCWKALAAWTERHPLRRDEAAEVVLRDLRLVGDEMVAADHYHATLHADEHADEEAEG